MSGENPDVRPAMDNMKKQLRDAGVPEKKAQAIVEKSARRFDQGQGARKK